MKRNSVMSEASKEYMSIVIHQDNGLSILPSNLELRDYQKEAIANWFKNNGRGTLKMATGSGKTITALAIARCKI
jgi:superfamily II DNA or RNA helicase